MSWHILVFGKGIFGRKPFFYDAVQNDRDQNQGRANVERNAHFFVLAQDDAGQDYAVNRFEIGREHDRVWRKLAHDVNRSRKGKCRANAGQNQDIYNVARGKIKEFGREFIVVKQIGRNQQKTREKFVNGDHRRIVLLDQLAIEQRKNHADKNRKKRVKYSVNKPYGDLHDYKKPNDDQQPKKDLVPKHFSFVEQWFENSGKERAHREHGERDRNIGKIDRLEEIYPMYGDQKTN